MALPTGTVTFLFTDIQGSTELVERLGDAYPAVLDDHRALLRDAVADAEGTELDCRGDEFLFVFADASRAVETALRAQRALAAHQWPAAGVVEVRMGLHSGEPTVQGSSYVGIDVHRVARIAGAGHGGQVLLSERTREPGRCGCSRSRRAPVQGPADAGARLPAGRRGPARGLPAASHRRRRKTDAPTSNETRMRVVVAEDSVLLREGIARLLDDAGIEVVGQAGTADELMLKVRSYKPDVAIVDIRMPPTQTDEGLRAAKEIREKHPETAVLVLSQYLEPAYALELLSESAEGVGYLLKDRVADIPEFVAAVKRVGEGGSALDPSVVSQLVGRRRQDDPIDQLTPREREVLELMAEGLSNVAVAERLVVTERAIEKHVTSIFGKLRLGADSDHHRRVLAVLAYLRA